MDMHVTRVYTVQHAQSWALALVLHVKELVSCISRGCWLGAYEQAPCPTEK